MKMILILSVLACLLSGCASHKSCIVSTNNNSTTLELRKDLYGLVPGICGFKSHVMAMEECFLLHGNKDTYRDREIEPVRCDPLEMLTTTNYGGYITIWHDKRRVKVNLNRNGYPAEFNGNYSY